MTRTPEEQRLHQTIESYVAPLRNEIKALRKELSEIQAERMKLSRIKKL
jgi:prefoldin subunit 5